MDRFHTNICNTLYNHLKPGLNPPILTKAEDDALKKNIQKLVLSSNLHVFDEGDVIWRKLGENKSNFAYFNDIKFL